jgi:hypothetical protein
MQALESAGRRSRVKTYPLWTNATYPSRTNAAWMGLNLRTPHRSLEYTYRRTGTAGLEVYFDQVVYLAPESVLGANGADCNGNLPALTTLEQQQTRRGALYRVATRPHIG